MGKNKKILFVTATHGDEAIGIEVAKQLRKTKFSKRFSSIIANPRALKEKVRFIDADLNRVFPGNTKGNYEERRANMLLKKIQKYDCVIDLHGTVSRTGIFIIITRLNLRNLKLALSFDIKKIVLWPDAGETNGSLATLVKVGAGIEIESGNKSDSKVREKLKKILADFLAGQKEALNIEEELVNREFFMVIGKIKINGKRIKKLKDWKKVQNFYPVFVGQYPGIVCYKLKKINSKNMLEKLRK